MHQNNVHLKHKPMYSKSVLISLSLEPIGLWYPTAICQQINLNIFFNVEQLIILPVFAIVFKASKLFL